MRIAVAFAVPLMAAFSMICANLRQAAAVYVVRVLVRGFMRMLMTTVVIVSMIVLLLLPENFARQVLFAVGVDIDFGRRNSASHHARNLQPRADIERRDRVLQKFGRHPGIHQRAQKHVATDAGETVEVGYAHGTIVVGRWSLVVGKTRFRELWR